MVLHLLGVKKSDVSREDVMPIVMACMSMSKQKVGALIVIEQNVGLNEYIRSGDMINANITQRLIENIFFKNSPLHDGAMIISHKRITAAGCILPVAHDSDIPKALGLRHRAALGISQKQTAWPSSSPKRQAASPWPRTDSSTCASQPRSSNTG